jgi:hypothetical protein
MADMVSFGVAPALLIYFWQLSEMGQIGWIGAFVYTAAGALRLARFNTQIGVEDKRYFQGLPSPAAAALIAGLVWAKDLVGVTDYDQYLAMVSWGINKAGATPNETISAIESYCSPNALWVLVSRATRPSKPSHTIATKIAIAASAYCPLVAKIMEKNPANNPNVVNRLGSK